MTTDQLDWNFLLAAMNEGHVVPFIGRDLLVVRTDSGPHLYDRVVASHLAEALAVDTRQLPEAFGINDVAAASGRSPEDIQVDVYTIVDRLKFEPPEPLRKLAEIDALRLFISTTFDGLLEQALTARRRQPEVVVLPSEDTRTDFDQEMLREGGSCVFYLLGKASTAQHFAVTEGDVLELMHQLMAERGKWEKLSARLSNSHLLILGVSFPDWLARFLIKLGRQNHPHLWTPRKQMEVIVDSVHLQRDFRTFINMFSPRSRLFTTDSPVDFVSELHRRWFERYPRTVGRPNAEVPAPMEPGSIFISYAREDRAAAYRLCDELTKAELEVWIDKRLNPGDKFSPEIARHIMQCSAFVALLSRTTRDERERYFFREWDAACDRAKGIGEGTKFLFPVEIDEAPIGSMFNIPEKMAAVSATRAPFGEPPPQLIETLRRVQQEYRNPRQRNRA
jgi:hypothetical protein